MDDWYVICPDMDTARKALAAIRAELAKLGLELNDKTNIFPLQNGIDFCGFHTYLTHTGKVVRKLRRSSIKRMKGRIRRWEIEYGEGKISRNKIEECYKSWEGHAKHGDTRALRQAMRRRLNEALARAEIKRAAANPPPLRPGQSERRVQRYGKVTFCHSQGKHSEAR